MRDEWSCVEGTTGHGCPEILRPRKAEAIVHKRFFSAFSSGQLESVLHALGADLVITVGLHLHACIRATALDAYGKGFGVVIVEDASASDDSLHAAITRRYLQDRSILFCSSNEIVVALKQGIAGLERCCVHQKHEVVSHTSPHGDLISTQRFELAALLHGIFHGHAHPRPPANHRRRPGLF